MFPKLSIASGINSRHSCKDELTRFKTMKTSINGIAYLVEILGIQKHMHLRSIQVLSLPVTSTGSCEKYSLPHPSPSLSAEQIFNSDKTGAHPLHPSVSFLF